MRALKSRTVRWAAVLTLSGYCCLLLAAALPFELLGARSLVGLRLAAGYALHSLGITPGLEVFAGKHSKHAIHWMTCFRVVGQAEGQRQLVLYDDMTLCRDRRVEPVRDPFRVLQMSQLSAALVDLNQRGKGDLRRDILKPLFLFSDYYCNAPEAKQALVERVTIEALYLGLNLQDGTRGEVPMRGSRVCTQPTWVVGP